MVTSAGSKYLPNSNLPFGKLPIIQNFYGMTSPFLFGRAVSEEAFTNRIKDINRLTNNLKNRVNTIIISPRRWGKSSLVKKVAKHIESKSIKVVHLDLLSIKNETDFYELFASECIKSTSGKLSEWVQAGKQFFKQIRPRISMGTDPTQDFSVSFEIMEMSKHYKEILNLPEKLALQKKTQIVVCIDEFQSISSFKDPLPFQKKLRSEWQHQQHVTYCLYGSKQHRMTELFVKQSYPFYKFGDVFYLQKIERSDWIMYLIRQFESTKKIISPEQSDRIASLTQDHSHYVQQLAYLVWIITEHKVTDNIIAQALNTMMEQNSLLYIRDIENLSSPQFDFLRAISDGLHVGLSGKQALSKYNFGTSANVLKIKISLIEKELIDETHTGVFFNDPVFKLWFSKYL